MNIQSIQIYNSTNKNQTKKNYQNFQVKSSINAGKTYSQSFGIGARGALNQSIAQGKKISELGEESPELIDMAEWFHTCPQPIIKKVSSVYEGGFWGIGSDVNEVKSQKAYQKFSKAINNVISKKPKMSSIEKAELNAKAQRYYDEYNKYRNI